jgi:hypothetical protein
MPQLQQQSNAPSERLGEGIPVRPSWPFCACCGFGAKVHSDWYKVQANSTKRPVRATKNQKKQPERPWLSQSLRWRPGQYLPNKTNTRRKDSVDETIQATASTYPEAGAWLYGTARPPFSHDQGETTLPEVLPKTTSDGWLSPVERERHTPFESRPDYEYLSERLVHPSQTALAVRPQLALSPTILDTISTPLTHIEKTTLWNYFHFVPTAAYGTTGAGPFCAFRDISLPSCQRYPQALSWMLIAAERHHAIRTKLREQSPSMLQRKAAAYKAIGKLLEESRYTDEALVVIIGAIVIESRFLDIEVTRMHMKGLETLIQHRGGLPSLFQSSAFMGHPLFYLGYLTSVPLAVGGGKEAADEQKERFLEALAELRVWNRQLRRLMATHRRKPDDDGLTEYLDVRYRVLGSPALRHYLAPSIQAPHSPPETYHARTSRFMSAYLLNLILWQYNYHLPAISNPPFRAITHDYALPAAHPSHSQSHSYPHSHPHQHHQTPSFHAATSFLHTLFYSLSASGVLSPKGTPSIRLEILPWIIAKAWVDSDPFFAASQRGGEEELFLTETGVRAVKLWGGLGEEGRRKLFGEVGAWILGEKGGDVDEY